MDLDTLQAFVVVVENGSFVSGARRLGIARPTLRRRIEALEARVGQPLLVRTRQGVQPTEAGALLAERGRHLIQDASVLISTIREVGEEPRGLLRIMLPVGMPPQLVAPILSALRVKYPRLSLQLRTADDPIAQLYHDIDVAVHFGDSSPEGPWVSMELARIRQWLVASPEYLHHQGTPTTLDALADHSLLYWAAPGETQTRCTLRQGGELQVSPALISTDVHMLRQTAALGMGIAYIPDGMLEIGAPLVPVLEEHIGEERGLRLVVPAALEHIPRIRALLSELRILQPKQFSRNHNKS